MLNGGCLSELESIRREARRRRERVIPLYVDLITTP